MLITSEISNIWNCHHSRHWKGLPSNQLLRTGSRHHKISMAERHQQTSHSKQHWHIQTRISFGIISSQLILAATIVCHLQSKKGPVAKKLMKDLYVDNLITGTNSKGADFQMYEQGKQIFKEMSMNLREWGLNSRTLRNSFKKEDCFNDKEMNVLGTIWNINDNCIYTPVKESYEPETSTRDRFWKELLLYSTH